MKAALLVLVVLSLASNAFGVYTITLKNISTDFSNPTGIDFHPPTNSLILSAHYPTGEGGNLERVESDGRHVPFSKLEKLTNELKITVAREANPGGFSAGEFFTGNGQDSQIVRVSADGSKTDNPWVTLPAPPVAGRTNGLMRGSLFVDSFGSWGGDLLVVTTTGTVWRVSAAGVPTFVDATPDPTHLEGMICLPEDPQFGPLSGAIIAGDEQNKRLWAFYPDRAKNPHKVWNIDVAIEDIDFIRERENFFGVNQGEGRLLGASAADFMDMWGKILVAQEGPVAGTSGLYVMTWDFINKVPKFETILSNGEQTRHWEHVTFSKSGVVEIPPVEPPCYVIKNNSGTDFKIPPYFIQNSVSAYAMYKYDKEKSVATFPSQLINQADLADSIVAFFAVDLKSSLSLTLHADSSDGTAGRAIVQLQGLNVRGNPNLIVQDDTGTSVGSDDLADRYFTAGTNYQFDWRWGNQTSDGAVLGPLSIGFCFTISVLQSEGISKFKIGYAEAKDSSDPYRTTLVFKEVSLTEPTTICAYDCQEYCFLFDSCTTCAPDPECTWCDGSQTCAQTNTIPASCGTKYEDNCPCPYHNADGCDSCISNPNCGWCCAGNGTGSCMNGNVGGPTQDTCANVNWKKESCSEDCVGGCANGVCSCGFCKCFLGYSGKNCDEGLGCDGIPGSNKTLDVCNVCGGNGTSCLGCDGTPFGPKYDKCGICGGFGNTCFDRCPYTECSACSIAEKCVWCTDRCVEDVPSAMITKNCTMDKLQRECPADPIPVVAVAAGISGGIIAAIVIASVVAAALLGFGAKKGYDYYVAKGKAMDGAQGNPLYNDGGRTGNNPFFEKPSA